MLILSMIVVMMNCGGWHWCEWKGEVSKTALEHPRILMLLLLLVIVILTTVMVYA